MSMDNAGEGPDTAAWPVVGHEWAVRQLRAAVAHDEVPHALLITGPESVGKMTLAMSLAKTMLCKSREGLRACGRCSACKRIDSENYPDLLVIIPEDPAKPTIKVDQIRALERFLYLTPSESAYKIAIVAPFETATIGAANALLKTLEEPPSYAHLILLASDAETLLPTIVSRSQQLALRPLDCAKIHRALVARWKLTEDQAERLARLSGGRLGWAVRAATDPTYLQRMEMSLTILFELLRSDLPGRFDKAKELSQTYDSAQLWEILAYWKSGWRDILLLQAENANELTYVDKRQVLEETAKRVSLHDTVRMLKTLDKTQISLRRHANTQLLIENLLLDLPHLMTDSVETS